MTMPTPAEAVCIHFSDTVTTSIGCVSTCRTCRQKTLLPYFDGKGMKEEVLERGQINGVMTAVHPVSAPVIKHAKIMPVQAQRIERKEVVTVATKEGKVKRTPEEIKAQLDWYRVNKAAMVKDLLELGNAGFLEKWKVPVQQISHLKRDKLYKNAVPSQFDNMKKMFDKIVKNAGSRASVPPSRERSVIVHVYQLADGFPAFNACQTGDAQCEWLRCYRDMAMAAPGKITVADL